MSIVGMLVHDGERMGQAWLAATALKSVGIAVSTQAMIIAAAVLSAVEMVLNKNLLWSLTGPRGGWAR